MLQKQPKFYTPEEYLALEEKADYKSEYYQGEIFAMGGGSDRGLKFEFYRTIDTLQNYILVDQERIHIENYYRLPDGRWVLTELKTLESTLTIASINCEIPINRIYHKVDWFAEEING